ncbi:MAG: ligase-associated DNA damage response endonuclease PdeM [Bacteroidetes bacterium]|nr:MAG: ligase-associated DNA damage response endonuclease PdeM [Bacteroidota bacterium]
MTIHTIGTHKFCLFPQRYALWENRRTLIVSDLHFGKTGHFRKAGIPMPQAVFKQDLQLFFHAIQLHKPAEVIVVGDMFHSVANKELDLFARWRANFEHIPITLVKGNHDILPLSWYAEQSIEVKPVQYEVDGLVFSHDLPETLLPRNYYIVGHLHPGVTVPLGGRQKISLPCFYFTPQYGVLPAFSAFSGLAIVNQQPQDAVFAITGTAVMPIVQ